MRTLQNAIYYSFERVEHLMCCIHACLYIVRIMNQMYIECYRLSSLFKYTLKVQELILTADGLTDVGCQIEDIPLVTELFNWIPRVFRSDRLCGLVCMAENTVFSTNWGVKSLLGELGTGGVTDQNKNTEHTFQSRITGLFFGETNM